MSLLKSDFDTFARDGYNRIPLMREVLADLDTPLSTYLKLAAGPYSYLLESVQGGEKWGRYSIIGLPARVVLRVTEKMLLVERDGDVVERIETNDPLAAVRTFQSQFKVPVVEGMPRFTGGLVGYFGYDIVRSVETRLDALHAANNKPDTIGAPDALLMVSDEVVVFDNLTGRLYIVVHVDPAQPKAWQRGNRRLDDITDLLSRGLPVQQQIAKQKGIDEADFVSSFSQPEFEQAVEKAREYIYAGDVFQVVLSQRLSTPYEGRAVDLYRALRTLNPSPYMYFIDLEDFHIVGSSPEILVRVEDGEVTVRPIAGTRRRGATPEEDKALAEELLADPKELAEHLMLVDLGRNDVGRVAEIGSVRLTERNNVEQYSHVMHIVSNVVGKLKSGLDAIDVLRATFPAGTVSGAPKVRAMEIIEELEPVKRGIYSGAVGYISWNGNMDTAIAIRTAVVKDGQVFIQAGAGIVADSVPATEWHETMSKGRAVFKAVAVASAGLDPAVIR
ncbi:MAG: anthranilate synthase component I [Arenicellales bacterium WSBS_2016_MAG_OTU3]